jgi:hypothetical protein
LDHENKSTVSKRKTQADCLRLRFR